MRRRQRVGGMESVAFDSSTKDQFVHNYNQIQSYQRYWRGSAHAEYGALARRGDVLLINVLTALMRFIILAFTLISCCPPYPV